MSPHRRIGIVKLEAEGGVRKNYDAIRIPPRSPPFVSTHLVDGKLPTGRFDHASVIALNRVTDPNVEVSATEPARWGDIVPIGVRVGGARGLADHHVGARG